MPKVSCISCKHAKEITPGPSPSGPEDGVMCSSKDLAEQMDSICGSGTDFIDEFKERGTINLFRIEVVALSLSLSEDFACEFWKPGDDSTKITPPNPGDTQAQKTDHQEGLRVLLPDSGFFACKCGKCLPVKKRDVLVSCSCGEETRFIDSRPADLSVEPCFAEPYSRGKTSIWLESPTKTSEELEGIAHKINWRRLFRDKKLRAYIVPGDDVPYRG